ncbi:hypothetical protein D9M68_718040 [compost metagenome]
MGNQHRDLHVADFAQRVELLRQQPVHRQRGIAHCPGDIGQAGEGGFDDQSAELGACLGPRQFFCQVDRYGAAQRMAIDKALAGIGLQFAEVRPGDLGILVDRSFRRQRAEALAEAAVVDGQHRKTHGVQLFDAEQLAGQVPARAVQVQQGGRIAPGGGPPPGMDSLLVSERRCAQYPLLDAAGQPVEPVGRARLDAEHQFTFLLLELRAADRQAQRQSQQQGQAEPALAQVVDPGSGHDGSSKGVARSSTQCTAPSVATVCA